MNILWFVRVLDITRRRRSLNPHNSRRKPVNSPLSNHDLSNRVTEIIANHDV
jgi:hypothetical protein